MLWVFLFFSHILQLEQEIDLILEKTGVFMQAVDDWTIKWAPAVLEYGYTLSGKKAAMVLTAQKTYESMHEMCILGYSIHTHTTFFFTTYIAIHTHTHTCYNTSL